MKMLRNLVFVVFVSLPAMLLADETININTADKETLMLISGIGEKLAAAIISYREENGGFASPEELANIRGIGSSMLDKHKDVLMVGESE